MGRRMQVQSIRFGERQWRLIQAEAEAEGVSASQFIRDAAYGRALLTRAEREPELVRAITALARGELVEAMARGEVDLDILVTIADQLYNDRVTKQDAPSRPRDGRARRRS